MNNYFRQTIKQKKAIYWALQIGGWLVFSGTLGLWNLFYNKIGPYTSISLSVLLFVLGIGISHLYRTLIIQWRWLDFQVLRLIPRVIIASLGFSVLYSTLIASIMDLFYEHIGNILVWPPVSFIGFISYFFIIFLLWSAFYLTYHYLRNFEKQEVRNLKLAAANKEMELNNLKTQLNPHFMFNALNGIRALIDEDPELAQDSLTRFSSLLRSTLMAGKKELISLEEELAVVKNYLALEGIRYEERLESEISVEPSLLHNKIPPFIIQTLVENAIKHGISKLPEGGKIGVRITETDKSLLVINVENDGYYDAKATPLSGIGLANSRKRLQLLFGSRAGLTIANVKGKVAAKITIPKIMKL